MTLPGSYFERMYAEADDPWSLETRWYEARKYELTVASLRRARYRNGFEPGCSIGVLTELLAPRCEQLLATDVVLEAVDATATRLSQQSSVSVRSLRVPNEWPDETFDLIVLSELAYYLSFEELDLLVARATDSLATDGDLVVVHWRYPVPDYPLTGEEVHDRFRYSRDLSQIARHEEADFLLDVFGHPGTPSVAAREGLA